jgi:nifR3 family TIM-barrel protein
MTRIGNIHAAGPLLLAPIAGFTDSPFRQIARRHGAGLTVTELVSAEGIVRGSGKMRELMEFLDGERPIGIQLFGNEADLMGAAAEIAGELGPDFIDINMGCPARRVCGSGSGAALLLDPRRVFSVADEVVRRAALPVTAKIRIGWDAATMTYRDVMMALEDAGVSAVFVHGRTRAQQYGGEADWGVIGEIARTSKLPIVGNGDIRSHGEAHRRLAESGCAGVMIGRGAIGNPWIFSGDTPSFPEVVDLVKEHLDMMVRLHGDRGVILMRKHLVRYVHEFRGARHARKDLMAAPDRESVHRILDSLAAHPG